MIDEALLSYFVPQGRISEEEYREELAYALEDYLEEISLDELFAASSIDISVAFEGTLREQRGGRIEGERVVFSIPLFNVLLMDEPLEYSLSFVPSGSP